MLVILNTVEAIRKRYIATQISNVLNSRDRHVIGEYAVDYTVNPFEIFNASNELVYRAGNGIVSGESRLLRDQVKEGPKIIAQAEEFEKSLIHDSMKNHVGALFNDPYHELANTPAPEYLGEANHIADLYANKTTEHLVLSGTYSKTYVEQLKATYGDDLIVINITRNPSVAYMMDSTHLGNTIEDSDLAKYVGMRLIASFLNCAQLKTLPYVTTIKFEDILKDGSITVDGKQVPLSYDNFNNIISNFERLHTLAEEPNLAKRDELPAFNNVMSNHAKHCPSVTHIPDNIFAELGYDSPITLSEMITPLAEDANSQP